MANKYRHRFGHYIEEIFTRLPTDVVKWVSDNVTLHEPPEDDCLGFKFKSETPYHVIFLIKLFEIPIKNRLFTMAHEIAHCYLGHDGKHDGSKLEDKNEEEADLLAKEWGF
jgi:Zn-dependent peptidase ImmA (M78 family)